METQTKLRILALIIMGVAVLELGVLIGLYIPSTLFSPGGHGGVQPQRIHVSRSALSNYTLIEKLVSDYAEEHKYYEHVYDCDEQAADLWDQIMAKGINAKLVVGSIEKDVASLDDADHVWVIAEISPGEWLAADTTNGRVFLSKDVPRYYKGYVFDDPAQLLDYSCRYNPGMQPVLTLVIPLAGMG